VARTPGAAAEVTRARILEVATELFYARGYAGTSIRDIAEALGLTKGALYYHFAGKEALLDAMVAPLFDGLERLTQRVAGGELDPESMITGLIELYSAAGSARLVAICLGDPSVMRHLFGREDVIPRFAALDQVLAGLDGGPAAGIRARCAIGAVHVGMLGTLHGPPSAGHGTGPRPLTGREKDIVRRAALAALHVGASPA
jgi:AcrR family transcriptional regulator